MGILAFDLTNGLVISHSMKSFLGLSFYLLVSGWCDISHGRAGGCGGVISFVGGRPLFVWHPMTRAFRKTRVVLLYKI